MGSQPASIKARVRRALRDGLQALRPGLSINDKGYAPDWTDNLLPDVPRDEVERDLGAGNGGELRMKFAAAHSSAALAVNTFGPFKRRPEALRLAGGGGFALTFERKCPTGVGRGNPPNLDLIAENDAMVVGVESKCIEPLVPHRARFSHVYLERIEGPLREGPWFAEMLRLIERPDELKRLDAAQLVKHAFGLAHCFRDKPVELLYLFWEPPNAAGMEHFTKHRDELREFAARVAGGYPSFRAMSYPELWSEWAGDGCPSWLAQHLDVLRRRYGRPI